MRLVSYGPPGGERPGILDDSDNVVDLDHFFAQRGLPALDMTAVLGLLDYLADDLRREADVSPHRFPAGSVRLGPPLPRPRNILGIGMNYASRPGMAAAIDPTADFASAPPIFAKPQAAVVGWDEVIDAPAETAMLDYEVEIALVIGRRASRVPAELADRVIAGYMIVNDVTAHDVMMSMTRPEERAQMPAMKAQFLVGKGFDTFLPSGPWLLAGSSHDEKRELSLHVNGELRQHGFAGDMIRTPAQVVELISRFTTLAPGDLILTGTPPGGGITREPPMFLQPGDLVEAAIAPDLGRLQNRVVATAGELRRYEESRSA